ncbi:perilipin-3-like [Gopherus evgoodei]|uniref:perilipin-3-like n=1 Tax=Gopherus evgoodei TaxID=1825980 RepID=UPI0011CF35DC|nr:perilipin-3-like [Gopherus evgoodei]
MVADRTGSSPGPWTQYYQNVSSSAFFIRISLLKYCIIALIRIITQPLKTIYQILLVIIEHFPINFQDMMQQVSHTTEVLHASVSTLDSFQDLSRQILSQIWEKVTKEEEHMNELLEYVVYSTPLCWFVGPFNALRGRT